MSVDLDLPKYIISMPSFFGGGSFGNRQKQKDAFILTAILLFAASLFGFLVSLLFFVWFFGSAMGYFEVDSNCERIFFILMV